MSQIEDLAREIKASLGTTNDELKAFAEKSRVEIQNAATLSADTKASVDKLLIAQGELTSRLQSAEQLIVKLEEGGGSTHKSESMGEMFTASEGFEAYASRAAGGAKASHSFSIKAAVLSLPTSAGSLIQPDRIGMVRPLEQRLTIRDLLSWGRTTSNSIEYVRESGFTNNANVVSENPTGLKPESDLTFEPDSAPVATIAHWIRASRQVLSDVPMLQSYIDGRLRYGLKLKEEAQLLKGSGVGLNILGLYTAAEDFLNPGVVVQNETGIDRLRIAMLQVTLAEMEADGIVLSPVDWAAIELAKTTLNSYLFAQPQGVATPSLWGRPVVATQSMDVGDYLVGAFQAGAQGWDREDVTVTVSTEDRDNFVKNMVTILCEERVALTIFRPEAFVKGDLPAISPT